MRLITNQQHLPSVAVPCGLTIGSFDGVHRGHQHLIQRLRSLLPPEGVVAVFTFSNHPSTLFHADRPTRLICPLVQKLEILLDYGADLVIVEPFDQKFASKRFDQFLLDLRHALPFKHFVLGEGATFGKNREGDAYRVTQLALEHQFEAHYLPALRVEERICSSRMIRDLILRGELKQTALYLGRPYTLSGRCDEDGSRLYCSFPGICLPPEGIYPVSISVDCMTYPSSVHSIPDKERVYLKETLLADTMVTITF